MREMKNSGIEWISDIPTDWKLERLKAIFLERKEKNDDAKITLYINSYRLITNHKIPPYITSNIFTIEKTY